jgi:hypothetical protein
MSADAAHSLNDIARPEFPLSASPFLQGLRLAERPLAEKVGEAAAGSYFIRLGAPTPCRLLPTQREQ